MVLVVHPLLRAMCLEYERETMTRPANKQLLNKSHLISISQGQLVLLLAPRKRK